MHHSFLSRWEVIIQLYKRYGILGIAGYVARKHIDAIYATGGRVACGYDPASNVGFLDQYDRTTVIKSKEGDFWQFCMAEAVECIVICTPNHLHAFQAQQAMHFGFDVILEKPPVLSSDEVLNVQRVSSITGRVVHCIAQLRYHPSLSDFYKMLRFPAELTCEYITPRGAWYEGTWKSYKAYSGGLIFNIGIHLLDIACFLIGEPDSISLYERDARNVKFTSRHAGGFLNATLSIEDRASTVRNFYSSSGAKLDLNINFSNSHYVAYQQIQDGNSITIEDMIPAIRMAKEIANMSKR